MISPPVTPGFATDSSRSGRDRDNESVVG